MPTYPILKETHSLSSPGLWVDQGAVQRNISQMISIIGGLAAVHRLRPHVKTHKMIEVIKMQVAAGITKCKAATPAEAKIAAIAGMQDILIAHQLVGPKIQQVADLISNHPETGFSVVVDDREAFTSLVSVLTTFDHTLSVWIDVDCGMHRSGIPFGEGLDDLRKTIESTPGVRLEGLHIYDGHLRDPSLAIRREQCEKIIESVHNYLSRNGNTGVVGGGSPTFGIWAGFTEWECSPGTTLFWDCGYGDNFPDLSFEVAAGLVTRVISKPGENLICLDLGHKSIGSEMALDQRAIFPELDEYRLIKHSEEHLVVEVPDSSKFEVGTTLTAIPRHICPTVALHAYASVIDEGKPTGERWKVAARDRL